MEWGHSFNGACASEHRASVTGLRVALAPTLSVNTVRAVCDCPQRPRDCFATHHLSLNEIATRPNEPLHLTWKMASPPDTLLSISLQIGKPLT